MKFLVQPLPPKSAQAPQYLENRDRKFTIASLATNLVLTSPGLDQLVTQTQWSEQKAQRWKFNPNSDGTFGIYIPDGSNDGFMGIDWSVIPYGEPPSGQYIEVVDGGAAGLQVRLGKPVKKTRQQWRLIEVNNGFFRIESVHCGKVLQVSGGEVTEGMGVELGVWDDAANQKWLLSEVRSTSVVYDDKITIYKDANWNGVSQQLGMGAYKAAQLVIKNDALSSAKIPPGLRLTIYADSNFRGEHRSYTEDVAYVGDNWNDRTSSVLVEKVATVYENDNYSGTKIVLGVGRYVKSQIQKLNDKINSIKVPQGLIVTMYEHDNFGGEYRSFYCDTPVIDAAFINKASSIIVKHVGVIIPSDVVNYGGTIQLLGQYGKYVRAEADGRVLASQTSPLKPETFTIYRAGASVHQSLVSFGDIIALKSSGGKYVSATSSGDATALATAIGDEEQFEIVRAGDSTSKKFIASNDRIALRSVKYNKYLTLDSSGDASVNDTIVADAGAFTLKRILSTTSTITTGVNVCGAEACGADVCSADACGANACSAAACGSDAALIEVCGAAAAGIAVCGMDATGVGACGAAGCGAAASGIAACGADVCGAASCGAAACGTAACGAAACGADACGADASPIGVCGANACGADVGGIDACGADACGMNYCGINACPADACGGDACAIDIIPVIPFI